MDKNQPMAISAWSDGVTPGQLAWIFGKEHIILAGWCAHCSKFSALLVSEDDEVARCARCERDLADVVTVEDVG